MIPQWHADVDLPHQEPPTDHQTDTLTDHLPGLVSTIHDATRGRLTLRFEVAARTLGRAVDNAIRAAQTAAGVAFGPPYPQAIGVRVLTVEDHERDLTDGDTLDLISQSAIAAMIGTSRQRVHTLSRSHPDFPRPVVPAEQHGPLYSRASVQRFVEEWSKDKPKGRPPKKTDR